jgi:hypothetical protein
MPEDEQMDKKSEKSEKKDTNSLLTALLEETRLDAELEMIQMEERRKKEKEEQERKHREEEQRRREAYKRQLLEEKRKRTYAMKRFEKRQLAKEAPKKAEDERPSIQAQEKGVPKWALIAGGVFALAVVAVLAVVLTRPSTPPVVFNPSSPDGVGKALNYQIQPPAVGPVAVRFGRAMTPEQVVLNTSPRLYVVRPPKPKKRVRVHKRRKPRKHRVKIKVKLFSPDSIIK